MNVKNSDDLAFAQEVQRMIRIGASSSDLQYSFPEYFGLDPNNASAKAARIYKDLRPSSVRVNHKRITSMQSLLKLKSKHAIVSDFIKMSYPVLVNAKPNDNMNRIFVGCYETWLNNFEEPGNPNPQLNYQQAFAVFRYVSGTINSREPLKFEKCDNCESHYPLLQITGKKRACKCPYCK